MDGVLAPFVINMFYFCDPDGRSDYVQTHEALPVDEMTPTLGTLEMENITATDAQYAGCWFSGLPEHPIEGVKMHNVKISFAPDAKAGQAAMMCGANASARWASMPRTCIKSSCTTLRSPATRVSAAADKRR